MSWKGRLAAGSVAVGCLVLATSCGLLNWKGDTGAAPEAEKPAPAGRWRPGPTSIRIYPSSRMAMRDGQLYFEAFIELLDDMGDSAKGVGALQFEMFRAPTVDGDGPGQRLYVWNVNLHTLADQQRHYDGTLRTYEFRLKMYPLPPDVEHVVVRVMYDNERGNRMEAEAHLPAAVER